MIGVEHEIGSAAASAAGVRQSRGVHPRRSPARARDRRRDARPRPRRGALRGHLRLHGADGGAGRRARPAARRRGADGEPQPRLPRAHRASCTVTAATSSTSAATRSRAGSTATTARARPRARSRCRRRSRGVGQLVTPGGSRVRVELKIAVAVGAARRFLVGDPEIQLIDVLAGRLIDDAGRRGAACRRGEVVLERSAREALGDRVEIARSGSTRRAGGECARRHGGSTVRRRRRPACRCSSSRSTTTSSAEWLLPAVYERMRTGRGELLAELRPAIPVFVRFGGIDYDSDDDAIAKLDEFVSRAQRIFDAYGGNLLQLTVGDKGAYLYGVFGSPVAHEDDAARAVAAALELRELESQTAATGMQIGIAYGRLRSGTYGHALRRTFVCLGDAVNLAARLMSAAGAGRDPRGGSRPDGGRRRVHLAGAAAVRAEGQVRARQCLTRCSARRGRRAPREIRHRLPMFGRDGRARAPRRELDEAVAGDGRVVGIAAEAGLGKSRLVAEFVRNARRRGELVAFGECQAYGSDDELLRVAGDLAVALRSLDDEPGGRAGAHARGRAPRDRSRPRASRAAARPGRRARAARQRPHRRARREAAQGLARGAPRHVPARARQRAAARARARGLPLARRAVPRPARRGLAARSRPSVCWSCSPTDRARTWATRSASRASPQFDEIALAVARRGRAAATRRREARARSPVRKREAPAALVALVGRRAEGNPFYIEELLNYIASQGVDLRGRGARSPRSSCPTACTA